MGHVCHLQSLQSVVLSSIRPTYKHLTCLVLIHGTLSYLTCGRSPTGPGCVLGSLFMEIYSVDAASAVNEKMNEIVRMKFVLYVLCV